MQTLIQAGQMLAAIGVGAREAIALGVIAEMRGKAQSPDIKAALHQCSRDPMAVVAVLKGKGLVRPEGNRNGWPFWRITAEARMRLDALNAESHKCCSLRLEKLEAAIKPVLAACHGLRDTDDWRGVAVILVRCHALMDTHPELFPENVIAQPPAGDTPETSTPQ